MKCHHFEQIIVARMDGDLYPAQAEELDSHLEQCPECRSFLQEMKHFSDTCSEFVVYPESLYPYSDLRARMARIKPLQEVLAYLPHMRATGFLERLAVAVLFLVFTLSLPMPLKSYRDRFGSVKGSFHEAKSKWEESYQEELDEAYRTQLAGQQPARRQTNVNDAA